MKESPQYDATLHARDIHDDHAGWLARWLAGCLVGWLTGLGDWPGRVRWVMEWAKMNKFNWIGRTRTIE